MSYVAPEHRRRGLISRLYEARLAWARARPQFALAIVGHRRSNEASRRAMERYGFRPIAAELRRWHDGAEDDYVSYELRLRAEGG
jgi:RimJ/RimL family protein N-acetyltransferase